MSKVTDALDEMVQEGEYLRVYWEKAQVAYDELLKGMGKPPAKLENCSYPDCKLPKFLAFDDRGASLLGQCQTHFTLSALFFFFEKTTDLDEGQRTTAVNMVMNSLINQLKLDVDGINLSSKQIEMTFGEAD